MRPPNSPATTRIDALYGERRQNGPVFAPPPQITCIDCGGRCFLLTPPPVEDDAWTAGDVVAYRCEDCHDRWDLVLEDADVEGDGRPDW